MMPSIAGTILPWCPVPCCCRAHPWPAREHSGLGFTVSGLGLAGLFVVEEETI